MKVWVLTTEYNEYDQHGKYFVAVFVNKPTHQQLTEHGVPQHELSHVLNGGGELPNDKNKFIVFYLNEEDAG